VRRYARYRRAFDDAFAEEPRLVAHLDHAARALGRRPDYDELEQMLRDFREVGVLEH
jgi:hypothetical protein